MPRNEPDEIEMSHDRTKTEVPPEGGEPSAGPSAGAEVESCRAREATLERGHDLDGAGWAWATEHRAPERASTEQLVTWLARGELPPHTLVWRPGWGEWLPAMQVAELAHAFPSVTRGNRRVARTAPDDSVAPPPVPVAQYPRLRLLAKDVVGEAPFTGTELPQGLAPAQAARRSLNDPDHAQQEMVTSQVPAAAMIEAARAMRRLGPPVPPGRAERWAGLDFGTFGEAPPQDPLPPLRAFSPLALELGFPGLLEPQPAESRWLTSKRYGSWIALAVLVGGALGLLAVRTTSPEAATTTVTAALSTPLPSTPNAARVVVGACRPPSKAVRLDDWAIRDVPPVLVSLSDAARVSEASLDTDVSVARGWVAVGYAQSHEAAVGLALSPESLEVQRLVTRRTPRGIFSVSPIVQSGELAFHAEREGASFAYARTVGGELPLRIGMNAQGLVAGPLDGPPQPIWELPRGLVMSVPAIAAHPGGLTIATRVGREQGPVRVGVMSAHGERLSPLGQIGGADARFGRPALASGGGTTALAVAARSADGSQQSLWLSHATAGEPPLVLQPFEPMLDEPLGGGGAELDTPAIAAIPGGGFGLLFTQGQGWKRRVRLQRLSSTLEALGAPIDVGTPDRAFRGASVGALYWVNDRLLAFHFLRREGGFSLWVSSIECELG